MSMENYIQDKRVLKKLTTYVKSRTSTYMKRTVPTFEDPFAELGINQSADADQSIRSTMTRKDSSRPSNISRSMTRDSTSQSTSLSYVSDIEVTFHRRKLFMKTFKDYFLDASIIERSLSPSANRDQVFKAGEGAGRSGSFFFFSHDRKFIIKTMTKEELNLMLSIFSQLSTHFQRNPDSLLAKVFGLFTVKTKTTGEIHLMLMENTL